MSSATRKKKVSTDNLQGLIETDSEVKSYIYQQVTELNPYVTPETIIMVIARDPKDITQGKMDVEEDNVQNIKELSRYKHRIAIILQEDGATLEAEAFHDDIFEAIKMAKTSLLDRLVELQTEAEKHEKEKASSGSSSSSSSNSSGQLH